MQNTSKTAWIITTSMGYGHQRTAYNLRFLAETGKIINADNYDGMPESDKKIWNTTSKSYEFISSFKKVPLIGSLAFYIMDQFQKILDFYPKRDLSKPTVQLKQTYALIKKGWGKDLIEKLKQNPIPILSTFFTTAFMAEYFEYPGEIFCIICDSDISRAWAPLDPKVSKIKYLASTPRVAERLKLYGIKEENIFLTGYPLPLENIGSENEEILKEDLKNRLLNLDPNKAYFKNYESLVKERVGDLPEKSDHKLTLTFAVGGAGAQKEIASYILKGLQKEIRGKEIKIILIAGTKEKVKNYFEDIIKKIGKDNNFKESVEIVFEADKTEYLRRFNEVIRKTDILWTKPSELSFYAALGLPIIIAPTIGSQEKFNRRWLLKSGFGLSQENPNYVNQWLFDWINKGYLAEAAMQGFIEGEHFGATNIQKIILS